MSEDLKQDMDKLKTKLKDAKQELEFSLLTAISERVQKFKLQHGIAPSEIDVITHVETTFGRAPVYRVVGVRTTIPFDLDD